VILEHHDELLGRMWADESGSAERKAASRQFLLSCRCVLRLRPYVVGCVDRTVARSDATSAAPRIASWLPAFASRKSACCMLRWYDDDRLSVSLTTRPLWVVREQAER
jgi:hypothetical protein